MRISKDKLACFVTILLHTVLLLDARLSLRHYPDFFINSSALCFCCYLVFLLYIYRRVLIPGKLIFLCGLGVGVQILLFVFGDLLGIGFLGLGNLSFGSAITLLFYGFCLICAYAVLLCIQLIKWIIKKITST